MRNFRIDEASAKQPQVLQVNSETVRLYFDHKEEQREGMEGKSYTAFIAKYVELPVSVGADALTLAKTAVLNEVEEYDTSTAVNAFILNGTEVWLDKATRVGLMNSTTIAKAAGQETTTLWLGETQLTVGCDKAIQLLSALEMYALECFNTTAAHKKAVNALESVDEVVAYDITAGYPSKLEMEV